eukprot:Skav211656  [mRNA]  locus=scaffold2752:62106:69870:- [translate_table: standard]
MASLAILSEDQAIGPHQILAMLSGQAIRPFVMVEVSRENIVEDTARFLRQADAAALHLPLKVKFAGEEGQDEGGVRREFFQVLIRRLFDERLGYCFRMSCRRLDVVRSAVTLAVLALLTPSLAQREKPEPPPPRRPTREESPSCKGCVAGATACCGSMMNHDL